MGHTSGNKDSKRRQKISSVPTTPSKIMTRTSTSRLRSYFRVGAATTANILVYAATSGRVLLLEGRVLGKVFHNWALRFKYIPNRFVSPGSEAEIVDLVRSVKGLRLFGSAHSFNEGVVTEDVLASLDAYAGLVSVDKAAQQITVKAGTRVRDVVKLLGQEGLAFPSATFPRRPEHGRDSLH
jgi:hypothetical protein